MVVYSIKDLENLTGVKAHTLRVWEQRYGIIQPKRTETNIRYYLEDDLKLILKVALLNKNGIKISKIACLSKDEIQHKAVELTDFSPQMASSLDSLTMSILNLDEYKINHILENYIRQIGFEETFEQVVFPLLDKIGHMWMTGCMSKVHENFVTTIIIRKTISEINKYPIQKSSSKPMSLLFLPEGERQELSMNFMHLILRNKGLRVMNLGSNVSVDVLKQTQEITKAKYIFTIINELFADGNLQQFIDSLCKQMPESLFLISGYQTIRQDIELPKNCKILLGLKELKEFYSSIK